MNKIERIKSLVEELNKYCYEYYTLDAPTISDKEYDEKYDELVKLEQETEFILANSPTQNVGYTTVDGFEKVKHKNPMLSLDKTKSIDELLSFTKGKSSVLMLKLDGLTICLTYKDGKLVSGETRGNGIEGELITNNVKTFKNVPMTIPYKGEVEVIGEAIITKDTFDRINKNLPKDEQFKTCRNLAAGSVRNLNLEICSQRDVKFLGYIVNGLDNTLDTKTKQLEWIRTQGFDVVDYVSLSNVSNELLESFIENLKDKANSLLIPIDGMVVAFDDIAYGKSLGNTSRFPLHSIAYKFYDEEVESIFKYIEWQVGRTGLITPVAVFEPIELDGTTVERASVHNLSILKNLDLYNGDKITVYKANQIIPQIGRNISKELNSFEHQIAKDKTAGGYYPSMCPICGINTEVKISDRAEFLYCANPKCNSRLSQQISYYCSRNCMNIEGLSQKTIEKFIGEGILNSIVDIYNLVDHKNKIILLEGFGIKSFNKLITSIEKSKEAKLENFITALGILNVGKSTAKNLVDFAKGDTPMDTINNILDMQIWDFMRIKDVGEVVADSLATWFNDDKNRSLVRYLTNEVLTFVDDSESIVDALSPITGLKIYCTGTFSSLKKDALRKLVESNGGVFANGYAKSLDYLVVGSVKGSSKVDKALKDGVKVLQEEEFLKMVKGDNI